VPAGAVFGVPLGISFFGTAFSEPTLIKLASGYEAATHARAHNLPTFAATVPFDHIKGPLQQDTESDQAIQSAATAVSSNAVQASAATAASSNAIQAPAAPSSNAAASPDRGTPAKAKKALHQL
jgi:hypothetical protein